MSKKKEEKLKRLRKKHIWPSIVGLILFSVISVFIVMANLFTTLGYVVMMQFMEDYDSAKSLAQICTAEYSRSGSWSFVMERLQPSGRFTDSAALLDENGEFCVGYGERSYDLSVSYGRSDFVVQKFSTTPDTLSGMRLYRDTEPSRFTIFDSSLSQVSVDNIIKQAFTHGSLNDGTLNDNAFYCNYWIGLPVGDTGRTLLIRDDIYLHHGDLLVVGGISAVIGMLLIIPWIFLLINVICDVVSRSRVRRLIYTDAVTGGNNWLYVEHFSKIGKKSRLKQVNYAMVDFGMVKYLEFCACHGAAEGEALLEQIDALLQTHLRRGEIAAHYAEGDFVLVLQAKSAEDAVQRAHDISAKVTAALEHSHIVFHSGVYFADGGENAIAESTAQMYNYASTAKASLRESEGDAAAFSRELLSGQLWEHHIEARMEKALENEEFEVYLQPKYEPVEGVLCGAEALIRWISPEDGFVPPGRFIPIFEKNGFITKIDDYMISHVAAQQAKWISEGIRVVPVSVNVSRAHFAQSNLAEHIRDLTDQFGIPHGVIEIELTESAFFDDKQSLISTVMRLKQYGFEISMDDFGAGYSSLNSLKDLPLDVLKLDAEFFRGENAGERGELVVSEAIKLAKSLDMRVVAEGVEKKEQVDFLAENGCDMIQGYYFAKPMPISDFEKKHSQYQPELVPQA